MIDTETNQVVGLADRGRRSSRRAIAITPDGKSAYVTNAELGQRLGDRHRDQPGGRARRSRSATDPIGIAITPDGRSAYVANFDQDSVSVIDTATNQVVGSPIAVGTDPDEVAITPTDDRLRRQQRLERVSVIDTQTNQVVGSPITVGTNPSGSRSPRTAGIAYVANYGSTRHLGDRHRRPTRWWARRSRRQASRSRSRSPPTASAPTSPTRHRNSVSVIDTADQPGGRARRSRSGSDPDGDRDHPRPAARSPPSPPPRARPGVPVAFNASASSDPDGSIARYDWAFGDGQTAPDGGPTPSHTYRSPAPIRRR